MDDKLRRSLDAWSDAVIREYERLSYGRPPMWTSEPFWEKASQEAKAHMKGKTRLLVDTGLPEHPPQSVEAEFRDLCLEEEARYKADLAAYAKKLGWVKEDK